MYDFVLRISLSGSVRNLHVRIYRGLPTLYDLCGFLHPYLLAPDGVPSNCKYQGGTKLGSRSLFAGLRLTTF